MYALISQEKKTIDIRPVYGDQPANKIIAALYNSYPQKGTDLNGSFIWRAVDYEGFNIVCQKHYTILTCLDSVKSVSCVVIHTSVVDGYYFLGADTIVSARNSTVAFEHDEIGVFKLLAHVNRAGDIQVRKHYFTHINP